MKIVNAYHRENLAEGRIKGMGFAFAEKNTNTKFSTVMPVSPCKDFLNEVLFAEQTGRLAGKIYGFSYSKIRNIKGKNYFYLAIRIEDKLEKYSKENPWLDYERDLSAFGKNYKKLESFINGIEEKLIKHKNKIVFKTKIIRSNDDMYLVKMPTYWGSQLYLLSMYTLLLRAYQHYDGSIPPYEFFIKEKPFKGDAGLIMAAKNNITNLLNGSVYDQTFERFIKFDNVQTNNVHNGSGICSVYIQKKL